MATVSRPGFNLDQIDDATAALIVQLQDDDVENLRNSGKGKGRVDDVRDRDVALAIYQQELGHWYSALLEPPTGLNRQVADRTFAPLSDTMVERDMSARGRLLTASSSSGSDSDFDTEPYSEEPQEYSVDDDPGTIRLSDGRNSLFAPVEQLDAPHRHNALPEIHAPGVDPVQAALEYMRNEIRTMNAAFTRIDGRLDPAGQRDAHQLQYDLPEPDQPRLDERQTLEYLRDEIQAQLAAVNRLALRG
ncbi:hypothetical protein Q9189_006165 [Teloschistes chrysophthalmus]